MPFSWRRPLLHFFEGSPHHELKPQITYGPISRVPLLPFRESRSVLAVATIPGICARWSGVS
jgi:hypothetical protein